VSDTQFVFANDQAAAFTKQHVILQQTAGNRIFDGNDSKQFILFFYFLENVFECFARYNFYRVFAEILAGCNVVE
jgi:hypothetical protein